MAFTGFDRSFFAFMNALKANNNREWFADHKTQFQQDVEAPALAFITEAAPRLKKISPRFRADARRMGGSLFRIYRDTRFSADKTPYKTHVAMRFQHDGKEAESVPSFYLHLSAKESFGGGGVYHADPVSLRKVRVHIDEAQKDWQKAREVGIDSDGESLTRVPAGFARDHVFAEDLKRKNYFSLDEYTPAMAAKADFLDRYIDTCERIAPLMQFLTKGLRLRW